MSFSPGTETGRRPTVSFEFFPPLDPATDQSLWRSIHRLEPLNPSFVSVTYGADGSTRDRTQSTVARIAAQTSLRPAPHVTCVGAPGEEIRELARAYWSMGIRHIVALRGDLPAGTSRNTALPRDLTFASNLVASLRSVADFEISVAGYPEIHPESRSEVFDLAYLKAKCDAGASRIITQFFFEPDVFLRFRDRCVAVGIDLPITPGILPVTSFSQLRRFAGRCRASIPVWLANRFRGLDNDSETRQMIAASTAIELVGRLAREGVEHFHFYTLNRAELTFAICHALGIRPSAPS